MCLSKTQEIKSTGFGNRFGQQANAEFLEKRQQAHASLGKKNPTDL